MSRPACASVDGAGRSGAHDLRRHVAGVVVDEDADGAFAEGVGVAAIGAAPAGGDEGPCAREGRVGVMRVRVRHEAPGAQVAATARAGAH